MDITRLKTLLLRTPFFSGKVPPRWANISHFLLGMLVFYLFGWYALVIPLLKEATDIWLWGGGFFRKHHKSPKDLAGWYLGIVFAAIVFGIL